MSVRRLIALAINSAINLIDEITTEKRIVAVVI